MIPRCLQRLGFLLMGRGIITLKISTLITDTPPLAVVGIFISCGAHGTAVCKIPAAEDTATQPWKITD